MAQFSRTIFAPIGNLADAVALSVYQNVAQCSFDGRAEPAPGGLPAATHCVSSGPVEEEVLARYLIDPRFIVSEKVGRNVMQAFADNGLVPWSGVVA